MSADPARTRDFQEAIDRLPERLAELMAARCCPRKAHPPIPKAPGIYLFSEKGRPIYIGQTRNLRTRIANHDRPSSGRESATFAFNIAKRRFGPIADMTRGELEQEEKFKPLFKEAKERVAQMDVQFIEIEDRSNERSSRCVPC